MEIPKIAVVAAGVDGDRDHNASIHPCDQRGRPVDLDLFNRCVGRQCPGHRDHELGDGAPFVAVERLSLDAPCLRLLQLVRRQRTLETLSWNHQETRA